MQDNRKTKKQLHEEIALLRERLAALKVETSSPASTLRQQLDTVSVPEPFEDIFLRAQDYVERYFSNKIEDPRHSTISISGERYILVRAASMSVEFFDMVMALYQDKGQLEARQVANNLLFDVAHAIGKADARTFHAQMGVTDPIEKLSAGPIHFSFSGWAYVRIFPESSPSPDENYYLIYDHPFSFESDAWLKRGQKVDFPVCIMNAGYSSGWCEESFGIPLVSTEVSCLAQGDAQCRFIMAPPARIEQHLAHYFEQQEPGGLKSPWRSQATAVTVPEFFQRKRLEEALRESNDQLELRVQQRTAELETVNQALQAEMLERQRTEERLRQSQKMEAIGQLAGGIAHDFNNMLTIIMNYSDFLLMALPRHHPLQIKVGQIKNAAERSASLTSQLLAFGRKQLLQPKMLNANEVITNLKEMLQRLLGENIKIITQLEKKSSDIRADPSQLENVLINLAINARDAMPEGGKLTISTATAELSEIQAQQIDALAAGAYVVLTVNDNGCGMKPETMSHIFEPFFTTKEIGKGTGLGLSSAYGIIKQSGGHIEVESTVGQGATFKIYLPKVTSPSLPDTLPQAIALGGLETILLVEDEDSVRQMVREIVEMLGYTVFEASNGVEALELSTRHEGTIHLLLTDVGMPQMNGRELADRLCKLRPDIKTLYMSGYTKEVIIQEEMLNQKRAFIGKPFTLAALAHKLREVLDD